MRYINNKISILAIILLSTISCNKDFLNRPPLDVLSTDNSLASANELNLYVNQFYENFPGFADVFGGTFFDNNSDNIISTSIDTRVNGTISISQATQISEYATIKNLNYFFANYTHATGDKSLINQYYGEAKFFRAWTYFQLVKKYGDVTWVNKVLPFDVDVMHVPRNSRVMIVDSVLADLDDAIKMLPVTSNNAYMRIHKDIALTFKSRVALYEGTWQKYHKTQNDPFWSHEITDIKIKDYLTQAKNAALEVINSGRWSIASTGKPLQDYCNLFKSSDLSGNKEVMLWRKYNVNDGIFHSTSYNLQTLGYMGVTLSLVDDYLTRSGAPFIGTTRSQAQATYANELLPTVRDPRLSQTVVIPGAPMNPTTNAPSFPAINQSGTNRSITGFSLYKYNEYDNPVAVDRNKSSAAYIYFRYAETLLNYAEAIAELGEDPNLIKIALQPLRDRAGMPAVDFDREYNTSIDYPFKNIDRVIQSVRRERRVEFAIEGERLNDIFRWAAADLLIVGKRPLGTLFTGSNLVKENTSTGFYKNPLLYYDVAPAGKTINLYLTGNTTDPQRYIDPYQNVLPGGFGFNLKRDYLLPIQLRLIQLTDGKWIQNPGW